MLLWELKHYARCGIMYLILTESHSPKPLEVRHPYHQKLKQECPFLRKQTWKGDSDGTSSRQWMQKGSFGMSSWSTLSSWVLEKFFVYEEQSILPGRQTSPFRASLCILQRKKEMRTYYTFTNIFKLQSPEGGKREPNAIVCSKDCLCILH